MRLDPRFGDSAASIRQYSVVRAISRAHSYLDQLTESERLWISESDSLAAP
jgi:hypothetical protein